MAPAGARAAEVSALSFRDAMTTASSAGRPLLLDAAMGTELTHRGVDTSPPLWSARALDDAPEILRAVHLENLEAGADVLTANTFRTHERSAGSPEESDRLTRAAVGMAREAASRVRRPVFVAGSLAPLEDCYRPELVPDFAALAREHGEQARRLAAAGVDLILIETMNAERECLAAAGAALATGLPVVASMVTGGNGRLLSGGRIVDVAAVLLSSERHPVALGINCVPARLIGDDLDVLAGAARGVPLAAYANTGRPLDFVGRAYTDPIAPGDYAGLAARWIASGARLVGGCCGTTAAHTLTLRRLIDALASRGRAGTHQGK